MKLGFIFAISLKIITNIIPISILTIFVLICS
jgi:hypothetical protein